MTPEEWRLSPKRTLIIDCKLARNIDPLDDRCLILEDVLTDLLDCINELTDGDAVVELIIRQSWPRSNEHTQG